MTFFFVFQNILDYKIEYLPSKKNGGKLLVLNGVRYFRNRKRALKQYWKCSFYYKTKCPAIVIMDERRSDLKILHKHNHLAKLEKSEEDIEIRYHLLHA